MTGETGLFWERLEGETETAYNAFCVYRDLGITRTLRKAAKAFYSEKDGYQGDTEELPTTSQVQRLKAWSRRWMWTARCEAFDAEEQRETMLRMKERRQKMRESHFAVGQLALTRAAERLRNISFNEELPLKSVAPLIRAAADLQRLAVGEPTRIEEARGAEPGRPAEADDTAWLDRLTVEEQEELVKLAGLMEDENVLPENLEEGQGF